MINDVLSYISGDRFCKLIDGSTMTVESSSILNGFPVSVHSSMSLVRGRKGEKLEFSFPSLIMIGLCLCSV